MPWMLDLEEMYFYGGSSIRNILSKRDILIDYLDANLACIVDANILLSGRLGDRSKVAVNSLMCIVENSKSIFLSEYITRKLSHKCNAGTIAIRKSILLKNSSWQDWVAELEVLSTIRKYKAWQYWHVIRLKFGQEKFLSSKNFESLRVGAF